MHDMDPKKYERHITVEGSHANNQAVLKSIEERLLEDIFDGSEPTASIWNQVNPYFDASAPRLTSLSL